jgi:DNA helicase HerA-like ATPase
MSLKEKFWKEIETGYTFEGPSIILGGAMLNQECVNGLHVKLPLGTLNRHGLIAGATGTGKTKSLQIIAEQLSANSVPVIMMDVKGDLSGIAKPSNGHPKIDERHDKIGLPFISDASPVEFLTLSEEKGARLRATVTEFGPVLFSKILDLNETQQSIVSILFKYCDDHNLPLLDLKDFKKTLQYFTTEGKKELEGEYGRVSSVSMSTIMRKIVELEQQGAEHFFGERSFDVNDLIRIDESGKGVVSIVRLTDIQDKPNLFSTFMLQMLAEIYATFPEEGDSEQPKLVLFIDEAHLVFNKASDALLDQIEAIIKLIRSKGVGIIFVTQNPTDIPESVLSQLGMKVQHALRAFTAKDRKAIKLASENFPITEFYDIDQVLTELGIGEALVTVLDEKGRPTPLAHTMLRAPQSRMDILSPSEINYIIRDSYMVEKYNQEIDRDSAYEILGEKIEIAHRRDQQEELRKQQEKAERTYTRRKRGRPRKSIAERTFDNTTRELGRTLARELTRGILGVLGVKSTRRRR